MSNIQLAANLQRLRKDHHFTQTQFSKKLNISRQAYSNYETGKRIPDLDIIIRIANIYHISLENLLTQTCSKDGLLSMKLPVRISQEWLLTVQTLFI